MVEVIGVGDTLIETSFTIVYYFFFNLNIIFLALFS